MAYKVFSNGDALTGSELNTYLMNQSVMVFASTTARNAALPAPVEGMLVWLQDTDKYTYYNGSAWTDLAVPFNSNAVINGAFDIWQRGTSFTIGASATFSADRFFSSVDGTGVLTFSRQTFTPGTAPVTGYEGQFFLRAAKTAGTANTYGGLPTTRIEDVRTYAGQTVTWSFWAKADANITINAYATQAFGSGGSAAADAVSTTLNLTTSWVRQTVSFSMPSVTGKTIGTGSFIELGLYKAQAAAYTIDIWGVQLEAGSVATSFKRNANSLQGELAACQRYYQRYSGSTGGAGDILSTHGGAASTTLAQTSFGLPVVMRANPTAIDYANIGWLHYGNATVYSGGTWTLQIPTSNYPIVRYVHGSGVFTTGQVGVICTTLATGYIGFSAEL